MWESTLPDSSGAKAHLCKPSPQRGTRCPPAQASSGGLLSSHLPSMALWFPFNFTCACSPHHCPTDKRALQDLPSSGSEVRGARRSVSLLHRLCCKFKGRGWCPSPAGHHGWSQLQLISGCSTLLLCLLCLLHLVGSLSSVQHRAKPEACRRHCGSLRKRGKGELTGSPPAVLNNVIKHMRCKRLR